MPSAPPCTAPLRPRWNRAKRARPWIAAVLVFVCRHRDRQDVAAHRQVHPAARRRRPLVGVERARAARHLLHQVGGLGDHLVGRVDGPGMVLQRAHGLDEPAVVGPALGRRLGRVESAAGVSRMFAATRTPYCPAASRRALGSGVLLAGAPSVSNSSSDSSISAAATFSSRCATFDVPGIGSITGERFSSQASASCEGVASCRRAMLLQRAVRGGQRPGGQREPRDEADALAGRGVQQRLGGAGGQVVHVLHRHDRR